MDEMPDVGELEKDFTQEDEDDDMDEEVMPNPKKRMKPVLVKSPPRDQMSQNKEFPSITTSMPPKVEVDLSGIKTGAHVKSKAFGRGTIKSTKESLMLVAFGNQEKTFEYPEAFEHGFLAMDGK